MDVWVLSSGEPFEAGDVDAVYSAEPTFSKNWKHYDDVWSQSGSFGWASVSKHTVEDPPEVLR